MITLARPAIPAEPIPPRGTCPSIMGPSSPPPEQPPKNMAESAIVEDILIEAFCPFLVTVVPLPRPILEAHQRETLASQFFSDRATT
jgi:hypothetical protein